MMLSRKLIFAIGAGTVGASAIATLIYLHNTMSVESAPVQVTTEQVGQGSPVAPTAPPQPRVAEAGQKARLDWTKEYDGSSDYFDFVSKAAKAAFDGDSRAALYVSKALYICSPIQKEYANSSDPQSDFDAHWAARSHAPQWVVDKARKDFQSCVGFIKNDAFAGLPERPGGYNSIRYWMERSADDPVAQALQAGSAIADANYEKSSDAHAKSFESAQKSINSAIASRDPAALFQVGQLLSDGHASNDPLQGFALSIAACNLGYDCSVNNAELFRGCAAQGQCQPGTNYVDIIKKAVGDDGYAQAYARAQQIQDAMARDDMNALQKFIQLKR
jgi:hypothetical protein